MPIFVVWLDSIHAKIFQFSNEKMERSAIHSHPLEHPSPGAIDIQIQEKIFFNEITEKLGVASKILILGPGNAKTQFQNFLNLHKPLIARSVIGCETLDYPDDAQIADVARKFFRLDPDRKANCV